MVRVDEQNFGSFFVGFYDYSLILESSRNDIIESKKDEALLAPLAASVLLKLIATGKVRVNSFRF